MLWSAPVCRTGLAKRICVVLCIFASSVAGVTVHHDSRGHQPELTSHVDAVPKLVASALGKLAQQIDSLVGAGAKARSQKSVVRHAAVPGAAVHTSVGEALVRLETSLKASSASLSNWVNVDEQQRAENAAAAIVDYRRANKEAVAARRAFEGFLNASYRRQAPFLLKLSNLEKLQRELESDIQQRQHALDQKVADARRLKQPPSGKEAIHATPATSQNITVQDPAHQPQPAYQVSKDSHQNAVMKKQMISSQEPHQANMQQAVMNAKRKVARVSNRVVVSKGLRQTTDAKRPRLSPQGPHTVVYFKKQQVDIKVIREAAELKNHGVVTKGVHQEVHAKRPRSSPQGPRIAVEAANQRSSDANAQLADLTKPMERGDFADDVHAFLAEPDDAGTPQQHQPHVQPSPPQESHEGADSNSDYSAAMQPVTMSKNLRTFLSPSSN